MGFKGRVPWYLYVSAMCMHCTVLFDIWGGQTISNVPERKTVLSILKKTGFIFAICQSFVFRLFFSAFLALIFTLALALALTLALASVDFVVSFQALCASHASSITNPFWSREHGRVCDLSLLLRSTWKVTLPLFRSSTPALYSPCLSLYTPYF